MNTGQLYTVTYRTAVNRPWTRTEDLIFSGTDGELACFQDPVDTRRQVCLTVGRITELALSTATV